MFGLNLILLRVLNCVKRCFRGVMCCRIKFLIIVAIIICRIFLADRSSLSANLTAQLCERDCIPRQAEVGGIVDLPNYI